MKFIQPSFEKTMKFLKKQLKKTKNKTIWEIVIADVYYKNGQSDTAINILEEIVNREPYNLFANILMSKILLEISEKDKAKEILMKIYGVYPENLVILKLLGEIFYTEKNYEQALNFFQKILDYDPMSHVIIDKINDVQQFIEKEPQMEEPDAFKFLGIDQKELNEIRNVFNEVANNDSSNNDSTEITELLAKNYEDSGDIDSAAKVYEGLLEKFPDNIKFRTEYERLKKQNSVKEA